MTLEVKFAATLAVGIAACGGVYLFGGAAGMGVLLLGGVLGASLGWLAREMLYIP